MNLDRADSRAAYAAAQGFRAAMGAPVSPWFFDGIAKSEQEAAELAFNVNAEINLRKFKKRAKSGAAGIIAGVQ